MHVLKPTFGSLHASFLSCFPMISALPRCTRKYIFTNRWQRARCHALAWKEEKELSSSIALLDENLGKLTDISKIECELSDEALLIPCLCGDKLCMPGEKYKS